MAHDHGHFHGPRHDQGHGHHRHGHHQHGAGASAGRLAGALAITAGFLIVEVVGAWWFDSLALLADAGHMLTDVAALAIALVAVRVGQRPADERRTFGYRRLEVLAASLNALMLFAVAGYVVVEAVARLNAPPQVAPGGMVAVAGAGLVANLLAMRLLSGGTGDSVNVRGAYLEVWADMLGSLGVIAGAIAIALTGWLWIDIVVAVGIGIWVLPRTWSLLRETTQLLMQGVPPGTDLSAIRTAMLAVPGVATVHDLHVWATVAEDVTLTAHVVVAAPGDADPVRRAVAAMLADRFAITHTTLQTEAEACSAPPHV